LTRLSFAAFACAERRRAGVCFSVQLAPGTDDQEEPYRPAAARPL
jgi:hypothetical protein